MADIDKKKSNSFVDNVPPPASVDKTAVKQETLDNSVMTAQQKIVTGLSSAMSDYQLENMKKLAPQDEFIIEVNGTDKTYTRKKLKPKMIKDLREAERIYVKDMEKIEDPELRLDRDHQLLAFKSNLYFGMTDQEFENCDVEYLSIVVQATELRTQGFRQC